MKSAEQHQRVAWRARKRRPANVAMFCVALFLAFLGTIPYGAQAATTTFASSGGQQTFIVPAGVTSVHVVAIGGRGGAAGEWAPGRFWCPYPQASGQRTERHRLTQSNIC